MGLRRITGEKFPISPEEWHERQMRRHSAWRWFVTICELMALAGVIYLFIWLFQYVGVI